MEMQSDKVDIRKELKDIKAEVQEKISALREEKNKIEKNLQDAESSMRALNQVYELQAKRFGELEVPFSVKEGTSYRFAGMRLVDALAIIKQENPKIDKRQALNILEREGFDFRGKRPLPAVHFAWIALGRRKSKGEKGEE